MYPTLIQDCGRHLLATEDLLQKHALLETEIKAKSDRVKAINEKVKKQLPQQVSPRLSLIQSQFVISLCFGVFCSRE